MSHEAHDSGALLLLDLRLEQGTQIQHRRADDRRILLEQYDTRADADFHLSTKFYRTMPVYAVFP